MSLITFDVQQVMGRSIASIMRDLRSTIIEDFKDTLVLLRKANRPDEDPGVRWNTEVLVLAWRGLMPAK